MKKLIALIFLMIACSSSFAGYCEIARTAESQRHCLLMERLNREAGPQPKRKLVSMEVIRLQRAKDNYAGNFKYTSTSPNFPEGHRDEFLAKFADFKKNGTSNCKGEIVCTAIAYEDFNKIFQFQSNNIGRKGF